MISYDMQTIGYINLFEKVTKAKVKDCFSEGGQLYFIVQPAQLWKALGKGGSNIKKIAGIIKKPIRVVEFSQDPAKFAANLIYPIKAEITKEDNRIVIATSNAKEKGQVFGRDKSKLKKMQKIISKYFDLTIEVR